MHAGDLRRLAAAVVAVHALAASLPAAGPQQATFSSQSNLVVLHVTVVDRKSGFVAGLPREAFTVYEDGRPQKIAFFRNEETPVTAGLVIDGSTSMHRKRDAVVAAGLAFAKSSHPDDQLFTVHFNERVWHGLPADQPFTSDPEELRAALQRATARGRTALFDALAVALEHVERGPTQKKVLIVLSDGGDNASTRPFAEVLDAVRRSDTVIYTIGMADQYDEDTNPGLLKQLARASGADAYFPDGLDDLTGTLEQIARDIRSGYTIGYVPSHLAEGFRAINVEVASDRRLAVRARSGYIAAKGGSDGAR